MIDLKDLYWLAGIIEGEGSFSVDLNRPYPIISAKVVMTDLDVVEKCHRIAGVGRLTGPYSQNGNKDCWRWTVTKQKDVAALLMTIYPLMGNRRQEKIKSLLEIWKSFPYKYQRPCPREHDMKYFIKSNRGERICKMCSLEAKMKRFLPTISNES